MRPWVAVLVSVLAATSATAATSGTTTAAVPVVARPASEPPGSPDADPREPLTVRQLFLGGTGLPAAGSARVDSGARGTPPFDVFGVSWAGTDLDVTVWYSTRVDGVWAPWQTAGAGEGEQGEERTNTDALVAPRSDGLRVIVDDDGPLDDVRVVLVDPGDDPAGVTTVPPASPAGGRGMSLSFGTGAAVLPTQTTPRPVFVSRAQWGADESLRTCEPDYSMSMAAAAVHHTASTNDYTPDEAAGLVRGIYAYHTRAEAAGGRGWCDIGYNALVDRFGRIYEGRVGSFDESVVGVHTGGFNSRTFGVSVIGTFSTTPPPDVVIEALAQAIAWKFATGGIVANASVTMTSGGGASKYPEGTQVSFPTIYGHRDAQQTSCPGEQLYARLQQVRDRVAALSSAAVAASPRAFVDVAEAGVGSLDVAGWAFDPETDAALTVDLQVDHQSHLLAANAPRPDVGAAFGVGAAHGFALTLPVTEGRHLVCLWVRNVGEGNDRLLGCRWLSTANEAPRGFLDAIGVVGSSVVVDGWAFDEDRPGPVGIHLYVGSTFVGAGTTGVARPDVAAAFGPAGPSAGFRVTSYPVAAGTHTVCAYAINEPAGFNPQIGCRQVTVVNPAPVGFLDVVAATATTVRVVGWALDADTTAPLDVHVYGGGTLLGRATADLSRPDVARVYPGQPAEHGFDVTLPFVGGSQDICVYAINQPAGLNPLIACGRVAPTNAAPRGFLDQVVRSGSGLRADGWTFDPDTAAALQVHLYVDGTIVAAGSADGARPDVAAAYGIGAGHGFSLQATVGGGPHHVCAYAINVPLGVNPEIGCRDLS